MFQLNLKKRIYFEKTFIVLLFALYACYGRIWGIF